MDRAFLEQLYRLYGRSVLRRARSLLGEGHAAEDMVQEVFIRALRARAEFTSEASPMAWLYRITTNLCLNELRGRKRRRELLDEAGPAREGSERPVTDHALTLRRLLRDVPEPLQEIAVYYYVDEMSQYEIADLLSIPRRTVGFRLEQFRATALAGDVVREVAP